MRRPEVLALVALLAVGGALRFYQLGEESLWVDEFFSIQLAGMPSLAEVIRAARADSHPPLYFILLNLWCRFFSPTPGSARAFSAFLSMLAIIPFHAWARRLLGSFAGLIATAFMLLSPFQLWYAQEARMYTLLILIEALLAWATLDLIRAQRLSLRRCALTIAMIFLLVPAAANTHFFWVFLVFFAGTCWLVHLIQNKRSEQSDWLIFGAWALWSVAWLIPSIIQVSDVIENRQPGAGVSWIPPLSADSFIGIIHSFSYGVFILPRPAWIEYPLAAAVVVLLICACLPAKDRSSIWPRFGPCLVLLFFLFCALGLPNLISIRRPIVYFGQRYEIIATLPFYGLLALGCLRLCERFRGFDWLIPALVLAVGMARYHVDYFDSRQKRPFDKLATYMDERFTEGDTICVIPATSGGVLGYYLKSPFRWSTSDGGSLPPDAQPKPGTRLWIVGFQESLFPIESDLRLRARVGPTAILECADIPGLVLRTTRYEQ